MKLTTLINADTREGWLDESSAVGQYGSVSLCGCRSVDFLTDATIARNRYLESPLITARKTILCVDIHQPIPQEVRDRLSALMDAGEITEIVETSHDRKRHRWNDHIYVAALALAGDADLVCHWDADCIGYRRPDFDVLAFCLDHLNAGASYVCQQTPLSKEEHAMRHASTRFFLTKCATLDVPEAERLLDDHARRIRFPGRHLPCLEHILGAMSGDTVLYPPCQNEDFIIWNWVSYWRGTIAKLNAIPYDEILRYVESCGGVHGASDMLGKSL